MAATNERRQAIMKFEIKKFSYLILRGCQQASNSLCGSGRDDRQMPFVGIGLHESWCLLKYSNRYSSKLLAIEVQSTCGKLGSVRMTDLYTVKLIVCRKLCQKFQDDSEICMPIAVHFCGPSLLCLPCLSSLNLSFDISSIYKAQFSFLFDFDINLICSLKKVAM
jgi:hypothetical protein